MSDMHALDLKPGQIVGGYTLISRLGAGAMGSVWRVRDDGGHSYAMKILRDSLSMDGAQDEREHQTARERLRREAMALRKVRHPGVCSIVDMELDDSLAFIVTELIEGRNLREDVGANGRYMGDDLERLARKLISAVKAVHASGIIHRDIKPTNVMVAETGPVLVDFGIAMGAGESHVTRTGLVMGTPGFIAPEIIEGADSDEMTDWWSLASVLAFAATGTPVFGTKPMMAVLERAASGNASLTGLPPRTMAAFRAALHPNREQRCTPDELLQTISMDALDSTAWRTAVASAATDVSDAEMMPPFDGMPEGNLRRLWHDDDLDDASIASIETNADTTTHHTRIIMSSGTTVMPTTASPSESDATAAMPTDATSLLPAEKTSGPSTGATTAMPESRPWQADPTQTAMLPPSYATSETTFAPTYNATIQPSGITRCTDRQCADPQYAGLQFAVPQPPQTTQNPAVIARTHYMSRSRQPRLLLALPAMIAGAPGLHWAVLCIALAVWAIASYGFNVDAQLARQERRIDGAKHGFDWLLRIGALPWHMLRGAGIAITRALIMAGVAATTLAVLMIALHLPYELLDINMFGQPVRLPVPADGAFSTTGLARTISCAAGCLAAVFAPGGTSLALGAGRLRGKAR